MGYAGNTRHGMMALKGQHSETPLGGTKMARTRTEEKPEDVANAPQGNGETPGDVNPNPDSSGNGQTPDNADTTNQVTETAAPRKKAPDTSGINLEAIDAAALAPAEVVKAATPTRARRDEQIRMDVVAQRAYDAWISAGKPTLWQNMPVVTYFLDEGEELEGFRHLIKQSASVVKNDAGESSIARIRWGNEFTVSEGMAARLRNPDGTVGRPEVAGKTVLAWAVINKRADSSPATVAQENREKREADK